MRKTLLTLGALCATLLAPLALHTPLAQVAPTTEARVIVKYKSASASPRIQAQSVAVTPLSVRADTLGQRIGLSLRAGASVTERAHVVFATGISSAELAKRLSAESEVEYAVPDERRHRLVAPNDPLYAAGVPGNGPAVGQWYLRAPTTVVKASINAESAWDVTTGSTDVVVAVLDSGVRFDHPEMKKIANGGNLLDGYDMIADVLTANDGSGRDADASDPGDWISAADVISGNYAPCSSADIADSSWHGTQTASLIGALTDNGVGMASVGRHVRVLPVRVLGKCGGFDSDIIAGMYWAAGLPTGDANVPANANPAWIINMSLGGTGVCSPAYRDAVAAVNAVGTVVVASAGNSSGHPVSTPANCPGVIAVAGLRHVGTKVGFSDIGPEISISAPAGNCVTDTGLCQYPILTASNSGLTSPAGSKYSDGVDASLGTSFSAPLVAGTAALMLSTQPNLSVGDVRTLLQMTARAFPSSGATNTDGSVVPQCAAPQAGVDQVQCYCTISTCGAGMTDAAAATVAAQRGLLAKVGVSPASPAAGQTIVLDSNLTFVIAPRSLIDIAWTLVDGGGIVSALSVSGANVVATPSAAGRFTVSVTVTDSTGRTSTATRGIDVQSAAPAPPADSGGGALGAGWLALLLVAALALRRAT